VLYAIFIAHLLKGYGIGVFAANLVASSMCLRERKRQRERERGGGAMWNALHSIHLNVSIVMVIIYNFLCHQCSWKGATLPTANEVALKDFISCQPVLVLR